MQIHVYAYYIVYEYSCCTAIRRTFSPISSRAVQRKLWFYFNIRIPTVENTVSKLYSVASMYRMSKAGQKSCHFLQPVYNIVALKRIYFYKSASRQPYENNKNANHHTIRYRRNEFQTKTIGWNVTGGLCCRFQPDFGKPGAAACLTDFSKKCKHS